MVVKDPVSGKFFRLREVEWYIASQLDGATTLDDVRSRAEQKYEAALPLETLQAFVATLEKSSLLESRNGAHRRHGSRPGRIRGSVLYFRVALWDPNEFLGWLDKRARSFFTPEFFGAATAVIIVAIATTIANGRVIVQDVAQMLHPSTIPLAVAASVILLSAHEFAHGLTCRHYGGEVHEVGFMVMYFQPFFYCNVSDAWLFPERAKRMRVGFAGPLIELCLWGAAIITWRITEPGTAIHRITLLVIAISGIKSLFDLNPFLKLDGYYLLSDYLEMPNLRRRSFAFIGDKIRWATGLARSAIPSITPRERRVLLVYGLVATVSSVSALTFGLVKSGTFLIRNHQPVALLLLSGYASMRSRRRFRRLFGGAPDPTDPADDGGTMVETAAEPPVPDDASHSTPQIGEPHQRAPHSGRRRRRFARAWHRWIRWAVLTASLTVFSFVTHTHVRVGGPFAVLPETNADVRAGIDGIVMEIRVNEGDRVKAGDVIARLADRDTRAELSQDAAAVTEARANLARLRAGPTEEDIAVARADVTKQEEALRFAQAKVARLQALLDRNMLSQQEFDDADAQARATANELSSARSHVALLARGSRPEDIDAAEAQVAGLEARRAHLEQQLRLFTVVSPGPGVVATPSRELHAMRGRMVLKGDLIAKVYALNTVSAQIAVAESDIGDVKPGEHVVLRTHALPDVAFQGTVTDVATAADGMSSATSSVSGPSASTPTTFMVTTEIDNRAALLKPGMTGQAKIIGRDARMIDIIKRRILRTLRVEVWSWF